MTSSSRSAVVSPYRFGKVGVVVGEGAGEVALTEQQKNLLAWLRELPGIARQIGSFEVRTAKALVAAGLAEHVDGRRYRCPEPTGGAS